MSQKYWKITKNKNKKHNKIVMLARSKLNSIKTLISQALIDLEISQEEFKTIVSKKEKNQEIKENIRMISDDELNKKEDEKIKNNKNITGNNENV